MYDTILVPPTTLVIDAQLLKQYQQWVKNWTNSSDLIRQSSPYPYPMVDFATGLVIDGTGLVLIAISMNLPLMPVVLIDTGVDLVGPRT